MCKFGLGFIETLTGLNGSMHSQTANLCFQHHIWEMSLIDAVSICLSSGGGGLTAFWDRRPSSYDCRTEFVPQTAASAQAYLMRRIWLQAPHPLGSAA